MTKKPKIGTPFRWQGKRLLKVPEVGDHGDQCKGCIREEEGMGYEYAGLCEVQGKHDCLKEDDEGNTTESNIFIKDNKASIAEYIARRVEG